MFWKKKHDETASDLLISPEYSAQLTIKHSTDPTWGASGIKFIDRIDGIITDHSPDTLLDYGCGKGALAAAIRETRQGLPAIALYDPGIPEHATPPAEGADMVVCTDVLEHVEPELLDNVLLDLARLTKKVAYLVIFTGDCGHKLPDGRPAHLIQMSRPWWEGQILEKFGPYFDFVFENTEHPNRFEAVITRRSEPMSKEEYETRMKYIAIDPATPETPSTEQRPARGRGLLGSFSYTAGE